MSTPPPPASSAPASARKARNRGFWALRDIPTLVWFVLVVVAILAHRQLPAAPWLMIHLLVLGAATHAIFVWSQYFSFAMLRRQPTVADRHRQSWRLGMANAAALAVVVGVPWDIYPLTVLGAAALIGAVAWHGTELVIRTRHSLPGRFSSTIRYYISAAAVLAVGAVLGAVIARDSTADNLVLSHAVLNLLGWVGLTVAGTLVTLWPTILRTRVDEAAQKSSVRALPVLAGGVVVAAAGAAAGLLPGIVLGLVAYAVGLGLMAAPVWRAARQKPPRTFASLSVLAAMLWWTGGVLTLAVLVIIANFSGDGVTGARRALDAVVPYLAAGFVAQVIIGALSYLIPVVVGGGPTPVRRGTRRFDTAGPARIAMANAALVVCALPVSSLMRVVAAALYLVAMVTFLPLMLVALREQAQAKKAGAKLTRTGHGPIDPEGGKPKGHRAGQAVAGMLAVVLAVAVTAAADPAGLGWSGGPEVSANAPVKVVSVTAANYRFTPETITVPAGTHLKIALTNTDPSMVHDLVFANGVAGSRIAPGESETIDVGVISAALEGWCSIVGHRQLGMVMHIKVTGAPEAGPAPAPSLTATHDMGDMPGMDMGESGIDLSGTPGPSFTPYSAKLDPLPASDKPVTRHVTLEITDKRVEVAPGVIQTLWVYNGTAPGPVLHGRVGDTFVVTLRNKGDMGHSIDFHAGSLAPDQPMRTIAPGESLTYTFHADRSGIWMYHCSTMPMTAHIANGMYGAVVIEPKAGLPKVDETYVLVQSEFYLGSHDGGEVDPDKVAQGRPDLVVFNGYANQYDHDPLPAKVGDRVRVWVLDAGIDRSTSFHVVGGQFDTVWTEGRYLINRAKDTGSQAMGLFPAQGGFVELTFPEAGHYPFVSHFMVDAERGAHGIFQVTK